MVALAFMRHYLKVRIALVISLLERAFQMWPYACIAISVTGLAYVVFTVH
jgi:hypothetical protein